MKKKIIILFLGIFLFSCSRNIEKKEYISLNCSEYNIDIRGGNPLEDLQFVNTLERSLKDKLFILEKKQNNNLKSSNLCNLIVNYNKLISNSQLSSSGATQSVNIKIVVKYFLYKEKEELFYNEFLLFYPAKISNYKYSEMITDEKELTNIVENISKTILTSLIK